jgi:DNA-binding NtrC family response regulator
MPPEPRPSEPSPTEPQRILIVDDEPHIRTAVRRLLRQAGIQASFAEAGDGDEAVRLASQARFDLIISDQRMPGRTGVELLAWLRAHQPDAARVLMTAFRDFEVAVDAKNRGGAALYVQKPWDNDAFAGAVANLLRKRSRA